LYYKMADKAQADPTGSVLLELRRGVLVLGVLAQLRQDAYGYALKRSLAALGLDIDEGTLYPLLRRLEGQGLLASEWSLEESRPRRYYRISPKGEQLLQSLTVEWRSLTRALEGVLS
jgi:PadR family transcriptional regulator, regulatory protein PadR